MLESWSNLVFGMECVGCGEPSESLDPWLCKECREKLEGLSKDLRRPADDVACLYPMEAVTRKLIHLLKYRSMPAMAAYLVGHSLALQGNPEGFFPGCSRPLYFIPVPLHPSRFRERGYNQAELIAKALANLTGGAVRRWLRRNTFRVSQTKLSQRGREQNVAGVFAPNFPKFLPTRGTAIIVDDVYTTGATTGACLDALGKNFPLDVKVCTLLYDCPASAAMDFVADRQAFWKV
jgi:ComF family protein